MLFYRIKGLVILVLCVSVFGGGCSRDEGEVNVSPLRICLISVSKERPAQVELRVTAPINGGTDIPLANVDVEREENRIFLTATASEKLFGPVEGDISDGIGRLYGSVIVKGLTIGEYEIIFTTGRNVYNENGYRFPGFFLRIEEETAYLFTATNNKRYGCLDEW